MIDNLFELSNLNHWSLCSISTHDVQHFCQDLTMRSSHETMATAARSTERISEGDVYSLVILVQHTRCEHAQIVSICWDCKMWPIDSCSARITVTYTSRIAVGRFTSGTGSNWLVLYCLLLLCIVKKIRFNQILPRPEASSEQALKPLFGHCQLQTSI